MPIRGGGLSCLFQAEITVVVGSTSAVTIRLAKSVIQWEIDTQVLCVKSIHQVFLAQIVKSNFESVQLVIGFKGHWG